MVERCDASSLLFYLIFEYLISNILNSIELQGRLKKFSYRVVTLCEALPKSKISQIIENQLLRSSFSAAANYRAALKAQSSKAFIAKLSIAFEEIDESLFWIEAIKDLSLIDNEKLTSILQEAYELAATLAASRKTSQKNITLKSKI